MATTYLSKTPSSAGNRKTFTFSTWIKRSKLSSTQTIFMGGQSDGNNNITVCQFQSADTLRFYSYSSAFSFQLITDRLFRDTSAWMHILVAVDTTQATDSNRIKIYINGVQETSFSTETYPSQNFDTYINNNNLHTIGNYNAGTEYFDGSMTHFHFIDGTQYAASDFGESDSTSGIWKPKTAPSVTYGTNGFFLKFENSGAMGTDSSGNSNTFTVSGTLTQNVDTPSNNFATMNPLDNYWMNGTFANGNTTVTTTSAEYGYNTGTLGASSGKFYWEMKLIQPVSGTNYVAVGIAGRHPYNAEGLGYRADAVAYQGYDGQKRVNGSTSSYGNTWTTNDIIGIAMDLDNSKLYFSKNGTWQDSGDPTSGATGTGAISITAVGSTEAGFYFPAVSDHAGSSWTNAIFSFNFGNGYFQTTAVASAGTAPSEGGIFEYNCPSGYQALCTKGINSF
jgi:hypothetical protein